MAEPDVNDFCRLCNVNMRKGIDNRLSKCKKIYEREGPDQQSIYLRLAVCGLRLEPKDDKSFRICLKCCTQVKTLEQSIATLKKWKVSKETTPEPATTTTPKTTPPQAEKRRRDSPKTPRSAKKARYHPSLVNRLLQN